MYISISYGRKGGQVRKWLYSCAQVVRKHFWCSSCRNALIYVNPTLLLVIDICIHHNGGRNEKRSQAAVRKHNKPRPRVADHGIARFL